MEINSKADLARCIRGFESELDIDYGDGVTRSWDCLIDRWEDIESQAYDLGITRRVPAPIRRPQYLYMRNGEYDYITPYNRVVREIRKRIKQLKEKLPAPQATTSRKTTWWKLREYLMTLDSLPRTYEERRSAAAEYNQHFGHSYEKAKVADVYDTVRYLKRRNGRVST